MKKRASKDPELTPLVGILSLFWEHMPNSDDNTLIVLKGHLLVEEALLELAKTALPRPQYLSDANLGFHKLACVVRASITQRTDDAPWQLILSLNSFRNDLAHNLDSSQRQKALTSLFGIQERAQLARPYPRDYTGLTDPVRLRHVVMECIEFLMSLSSAMRVQ